MDGLKNSQKCAYVMKVWPFMEFVALFLSSLFMLEILKGSVKKIGDDFLEMSYNSKYCPVKYIPRYFK